MIVSPTEPSLFHKLGKTSLLTEEYGADFLIISGAMKARIGVQRKQFPGDLMSSLADGRLYQQLHQMQELDMRVVVIEGFGKWTSDGHLMEMTRFTKKQFYGLVNSMHYEFGCEVIQVRDMSDTYAYLESLDEWSKKKDHRSLKTRPGPKKNAWGRVDNRDYALHLLQSFKGIGPGVAVKIFDYFGRIPLSWDVTVEELMKVPGVGRGKAEAMIEGLRGGSGNE